ncbi:MAG TPA: hypothetical protein VE572_03590, partial [Nitrososphaeraceae archaeon]|nr:hypothetical protein [Nitrososphaeraceae archaeon]
SLAVYQQWYFMLRQWYFMLRQCLYVSGNQDTALSISIYRNYETLLVSFFIISTKSRSASQVTGVPLRSI